MSSTPFGFGYGMRFLNDAHQNWAGEGLPVYLRLQNSDVSNQPYADVGFEITVTSSALLSGAGTTDVRILPPPLVTKISLNDIGLNSAKLFFGARRFTISHTWVMKWMRQYGYTNPLDTFYDPTKVVGIYYDNQLYNIVTADHFDQGGVIITWDLVCNATSLNISQGTGLDGP